MAILQEKLKESNKKVAELTLQLHQKGKTRKRFLSVDERTMNDLAPPTKLQHLETLPQEIVRGDDRPGELPSIFICGQAQAPKATLAHGCIVDPR